MIILLFLPRLTLIPLLSLKYFTFLNLLSQIVLNVWMLREKVDHEAGGVRRRVDAGQEHVGHQRQDVLLVQV